MFCLPKVVIHRDKTMLIYSWVNPEAEKLYIDFGELLKELRSL
jgi:hypothetical protein